MPEFMSRQNLFDLVWSEPIKSLASRFKVADVTVKNACLKAAIPIPDRGFWAKKSGYKRVIPALPERLPAMDDEVAIGAGYEYWHRSRSRDELLGPLPPAPTFESSLESVRDRIAKMIGEVNIPREVRVWHPAVQRLLREDEVRREKQKEYSWHHPLFDAPQERRRLRLLSALFFAIGRCHGTVTTDKEAKNISLRFYRQHVSIRLSPFSQDSERSSKGSKTPEGGLSFVINESWGSSKDVRSWRDGEGVKLETQMREIAIEIVLLAEQRYRESMERQYAWRIKIKAELEEEDRKRKLEAERAEAERIRKLQQARVDRLLKDAASFEQASTMRRYVAAIRERAGDVTGVSAEELDRWTLWALAQADRIDPTVGNSFLNTMRDDVEALSAEAPATRANEQ